MKYAELIEAMHQFRTGRITRQEMVAAFALWQRPVECAGVFRAEAMEYITHA